MSPELLDTIAGELPVAIWMGLVPSGEVVYTNRAFREVLGIEPPPGAARGAFVEPYGVHLPDGSKYPEDKMPFERAIQARTTVVIEDIVIHRRDGGKVNLRVFAKPIFDANGTMTHVLEAFTDITREVEAERARIEGERRLARAQRLESIGQLVAGIAHDFNNLLTVTKLAVSQLLITERNPEARDALGDVEAVTDSAIALVRNLLGFSGRPQQVLAPMELDPVVSSVVELARRTFDKRITVSFVSVEGDSWIKGDRAQIEQLLMNLLVNARDAISGAGNVVVTTRARDISENEIEGCGAGRHVVLEITDDGCGVDPSIRDRIFEPYFTTKTFGPIKGTGLGLSTVHGIVRGHGGGIDVLSAAPRGTTMRAALPSCDPLPAEEARRSSAPRIQKAHGELVLVVDDERLVRGAAVRSLESMGYRVIEAEDGVEALRAFDGHASEIAAVLLDLVMPGVTARDVLRALRERRSEVPVLVMTGSAMNDELSALLDEGARGWLAKPFDDAQLSEALARVLRREGKKKN
jgi:PAS domain S-box-containing protein